MPDEQMPLRSDFYDYACKFFREPQFRVSSCARAPNRPDAIPQQPTEAAEPGSELYNTRLWRREKANRIIVQTGTMRSVAPKSKWDEQIAFFNMASDSRPDSHNAHAGVQQLVFHQFEDLLIGADSLGRISCVGLWLHTDADVRQMLRLATEQANVALLERRRL
jgi:regulator-associated protein of mTOR